MLFLQEEYNCDKLTVMTKWIIMHNEPIGRPPSRDVGISHQSVDLLSVDVCTKLEDILSSWIEGKTPKKRPEQRVPFLSEKKRNELAPLIDKIQTWLWLSVPEGRIFDAINEFKMVNPQRIFSNSRWNLELLIKVLDLRPDYSFKLIKEYYRVFPPEIMLIFMRNTQEDLDFFREIDLKTFNFFIKTWLSGFVRGINMVDREKILRIASMINDDNISNIRIYVQQNSLSSSQALNALMILLEKDVDLSDFTELDNKLLSEYKNNDKVFDEFKESWVFSEFQNRIINQPELPRIEIKKIIEELLKKAPGIQQEANTADQEWMHQFDGFFQTENFNAEKGLADILQLPSWMRKNAIDVWKVLYSKQISILSQIPNFVKNALLDEWKFFASSIEVILYETFESMDFLVKQLSIKQRKEIILRMRKYITKIKLVHDYANQYKDNPQELVAKCLNTDVTKLKWVITMEVNGANFTFYIHHIDDYSLLTAFWKELEGQSTEWWISMGYSAIDELRGTITLINWPKTEDSMVTQVHESAHADNYYLMPDINNGDSLSRAKDEIIAFLKEGVNMSEIVSFLFKKGWSYDYYDEINEKDSERYILIRKFYEKELSGIIRIAERFHRNRNIFPYYLDLLAITPVREWYRLEEFFL